MTNHRRENDDFYANMLKNVKTILNSSYGKVIATSF